MISFVFQINTLIKESEVMLKTMGFKVLVFFTRTSYVYELTYTVFIHHKWTYITEWLSTYNSWWITVIGITISLTVSSLQFHSYTTKTTSYQHQIQAVKQFTEKYQDNLYWPNSVWY